MRLAISLFLINKISLYTHKTIPHKRIEVQFYFYFSHFSESGHMFRMQCVNDPYISLKLSEVLNDIGVNERLVMKRRRASMLAETLDNILNSPQKLNIRNSTTCYLGSQTEGTTTLGLQSDIDILFFKDKFNIIQDWADWKPGKINYLMIQDNTVTPGYCCLQMLRKDMPLPMTNTTHDHMVVRDIEGRLMLKNTIFQKLSSGNIAVHGPSLLCYTDQDHVPAFPSILWPKSASCWLQRQGEGCWPTPEMKRYARSSGCFVVPACSKVSRCPQIEWRISTCLAERCLMFNLNITQIRCYVLLKMLLKTYLNVRDENNLSSYMCKTTLLYCVENTKSHIWTDDKLYLCLSICLSRLYDCLLKQECPHYIITENNLMAGQFSARDRCIILGRIRHLVETDGHLGLFGIQIDHIGERLKNKLSMIPNLSHHILTPDKITGDVSVTLYLGIAAKVSICHKLTVQNLRPAIQRIVMYNKEGNNLEHTASMILVPTLCITLGSILASKDIGLSIPVSVQAFDWIHKGLGICSNVSNYIKLASINYCSGATEEAEVILTSIERKLGSEVTVSFCVCCFNADIETYEVPVEFLPLCTSVTETAIQDHIAYCVIFARNESNCIPLELQYEMYRTIHDDMPYMINAEKLWMDCAVVDCLPYLYFLQYKTYNKLCKHREQQQALQNLVNTTETETNLRHRETTLNLLGQIMEQNQRYQDALTYFILSLQYRERNNAAKWHICKLIAHIFNKSASI